MPHINYNRDIERCYVAGVLLTKGLNQITDSEYEQLKKHPKYDSLIKNEIIKESKEKVDVKEEVKSKRRRSTKKVEDKVEEIKELEIVVDEP